MRKATVNIIILTLPLLLASGWARAQEDADYPRLPRALYRSGQSVLNAFAPISVQTRNSIVDINVNEVTVALGAVVESNGLVLTKASELKSGKLTCWLASGKEVEAQLLASDDENDVALVRIKADGLRPIQWARGPVVEGQWAVTPGLADTPQAIGIISTLPHRIRPERALIGVVWNRVDMRPVIGEVMPGYGAEKAGVKAGDVIVSVEGTTVTNIPQVVEIVREFREGQTVRLRFKREDKEFDATIALMAPKPGEAEVIGANSERESMLSGDVSLRSQGFDQAIEHDTVLEPWQCGGPLVNLDGKAIGLNIARANRFATYALPASLAEESLARLKVKAKLP